LFYTQALGTKQMMWLNETKEWAKLTRPRGRLLAIERNIYVIGRGPIMVDIDVESVDTAARVDGFLVEHDFPPERCRVITI
jgi:hypothetical protein